MCTHIILYEYLWTEQTHQVCGHIRNINHNIFWGNILQTFSEYLLILACQVIDGIEHVASVSGRGKACLPIVDRELRKEGSIFWHLLIYIRHQSHAPHTPLPTPPQSIFYDELLTVDGIRFECTEIERQACNGEHSQKDNEGSWHDEYWKGSNVYPPLRINWWWQMSRFTP